MKKKLPELIRQLNTLELIRRIQSPFGRFGAHSARESLFGKREGTSNETEKKTTNIPPTFEKKIELIRHNVSPFGCWISSVETKSLYWIRSSLFGEWSLFGGKNRFHKGRRWAYSAKKWACAECAHPMLLNKLFSEVLGTSSLDLLANFLATLYFVFYL